MNRLASLTKRAHEIRRRLFVQQPYYIRVSHVYTIVTGMDLLLQSLGRTLGAVFLLKGVTDLPDIQGQPAAAWFAAQSRRDINSLSKKLPSNYLAPLVMMIRNTVFRKFGETRGEESIMKWLMRFTTTGWHNMDEGVDLNKAKNLVIRSIFNEAVSTIRNDKKRDQDTSLDESDDEGKAILNPSDPNSLKNFLEEEPVWKSPKVRRILEQKAHPDAPKYLDLLMEGYTVTEIVGDPRKNIPPMLDHVRLKPMTPQNWDFRIKPKIYEVLKEAV